MEKHGDIMGCHGMMMAICLLDARDLIHSVAVPGP